MDEQTKNETELPPSRILTRADGMMNRKTKKSSNSVASKTSKKSESNGKQLKRPPKTSLSEKPKSMERKVRLGTAKGVRRMEKKTSVPVGKDRLVVKKVSEKVNKKPLSKETGKVKEADTEKKDEVRSEMMDVDSVFNDDWYRTAYSHFGEGHVTFAKFAEVLTMMGADTFAHETLSLMYNKVAHNGRIDFAQFNGVVDKTKWMDHRNHKRPMRCRTKYSKR